MFRTFVTARPVMPKKQVKLMNKDALWTWSIAPGAHLRTYQAFVYNLREKKCEVTSRGNRCVRVKSIDSRISRKGTASNVTKHK